MPTRKVYRQGTHRAAHPQETIACVDAHRAVLGITRLANVTGLDYLGIPVFMAMRPNARAISVAQGKGHDTACAMASALMEAAEVAHAEIPKLPVLHSSRAALSKRAIIADVARLPRLKGASLAHDRPIDWVAGKSIRSGEEIFVPFELVHTDFTRAASDIFVQSSNGLASGNHVLEAVISGLCEVIERDATTLFEATSIDERARRRIRAGSVREKNARVLLDQLAQARMSVAIWDTTSDIGVASFLCSLCEGEKNRHAPIGTFWGAGCHPDRAVALSRAVTEAAQSRLTFIAGSRDDLYRRSYRSCRPRSPIESLLDLFEEAQAERNFQDVPSRAGETLEFDVEFLLKHLARAGLEEAIAVDLSDDRIGLPVVRIIVPGLEVHDPLGYARRGARFRAQAGQQGT